MRKLGRIRVFDTVAVLARTLLCNVIDRFSNCSVKEDVMWSVSYVSLCRHLTASALYRLASSHNRVGTSDIAETFTELLHDCRDNVAWRC